MLTIFGALYRQPKANRMMRAQAVPASPKRFQLDLSARGYQVLFWSGEVNRCPGCGQSQWYVGRVTAECGICGTALPMSESNHAGFDPAGRKAIALHVIAGSKKALGGMEQRRDARTDAAGREVVLHIDGSPHSFAIQNISAGGLMGAVLPGMDNATALMVELEDGTMLPAEVRWSDGEFAGLAFLGNKA